MSYDFESIELKWQARWKADGLFEVDARTLDEKFYTLVMFPYPSGDKLHMGHWYQYGLMDTWARFKRMQGERVYFPMGFDAFGLPAENHAIKKGVHPNTSTMGNIAYMRQQFERMGVSYSWDDPALDTSSPAYYRWTQWVFLKLYERGLAYQKDAPVNWCPRCQTVLANEQAQGGLCERCESPVEQKNLRQWFFKITDYAERLLEGLSGLDWPQKTLAMQTHWIGRSQGASIRFEVEGSDTHIEVFTTRPDTLFGATYLTLAPEHPLVASITSEAQREAVEAYAAKTSDLSDIDRLSITRKKTGVFTGAWAMHPMIEGERLPIWVGDYVLSSYGTGAVMAVPAHDQRDFDYAQAHGLPIKTVVLEAGADPDAELQAAFTERGVAINSGPFDGMGTDEVIGAITAALAEAGKGGPATTWRLRDWLISRQRYWGAPIPIVHCDDCGAVPVPEDQLPIRLPDEVEFKPTGESPLRRCESFIHTACPRCQRPALREADTLDTFVCSSFYYLRFPNMGDDTQAFEPALTNAMLPVDKYVGGPEHACMHLLYARFINMVFHDMGLLDFAEPFPSLTHQGLVLGPDGLKMSKSKGNSVSPDPYVEQHGSDVLRMYLCFGFNYVEGGPWDDAGVRSIARFADRLWRLFESHQDILAGPQEALPIDALTSDERRLLFVLHDTIGRVTQDTERFMFNTSIARLMELYNATNAYLRQVEAPNPALLREVLVQNLRLLAPYAPHLAEEWWQVAGHTTSICVEPWPTADPRHLTRDEVTMAVMVNGKRRDEIKVPADATDDEIIAIATATDRIKATMEGKTLARRIIVPKKLINLILR